MIISAPLLILKPVISSHLHYWVRADISSKQTQRGWPSVEALRNQNPGGPGFCGVTLFLDFNVVSLTPFRAYVDGGTIGFPPYFLWPINFHDYSLHRLYNDICFLA
ncbi:uncharacterized protein B0T23DRAFT_108728 [Neurospora hispaniola]|uniref:Uncharacterized protein n=1 Tax=Neurospora hispaniola TaxID=588809 RepID=A0AAJ0MSM6_9PEZI|nr:hypothetical protein B0T23DRAFT_108728 [Neurospora hispaniola]